MESPQRLGSPRVPPQPYASAQNIGTGLGGSGRPSSMPNTSVGETAQQLAHGLASSMQRALGGFDMGFSQMGGAVGSSALPSQSRTGATTHGYLPLDLSKGIISPRQSPSSPELQLRPPLLSPHRTSGSLLMRSQLSSTAVPMATVGIDTNHDGRPNVIVTGADRNRDGIPDVLQQGLAAPPMFPSLPSTAVPSAVTAGDRSGASQTRSYVNVELRPGETIEISSPQQTRNSSVVVESRPEILSPRHSTHIPRYSSVVADTAAAGHTVDESEKRRIEIASLRQEVASLLRTNSSLHAKLNQANVRDQTSIGGSFAHLDVSASSEGKGPLAWLEERKNLEERAQKLTEECRTLEAESVRWSSADQFRSGGVGASAQSEPSPLVTLMRDRDDMKQRLHATELARCAAEHRVATAEAALARSIEELNTRKGAGGQEEARFGPWLAEEVKSLRRELSQEQAKLDDVNLAMARKNEYLSKSEKELAEARVEYDALVAANEGLRKEIFGMKEKVEADRQSSKSAEAELGEMQAQFRLREFDLNTEVQEAKARAQVAESSLRERRASLETSEAAAAAAKVEGLELQSQIEVLRAAHDEVLAHERQDMAEHESKASELEARAEAVAAERAELEKHLEEVETTTRKLRDSDAEVTKQHATASRELELLRTRSSEMARRSQEEIVQAEQRIQALLQQIESERQQNLELEREISIAREAAGEVDSAPWTVAREKAAGKPKGWASTALQMHRELEMLQRWKSEWMDTWKRTEVDIDAAKRQYQQQLQHNQGLQEHLEQMGHQAKTAMGLPSNTSAPFTFGADSLSAPSVPGLTQHNELLPPSSVSLGWPATGGISRNPLEHGLLTTGPDIPERPDMPQQMRNSDFRPMRNDALPFAMAPAIGMPSASHSIAPNGPVNGPFYDAYRRPEWTVPSRTSARAELSGSRRRRSSSAGRTSGSAPVVAPLLSGNGMQVGRPLSAGSNGRRRWN